MLDFLSLLKTISLVFQKAGCLILDVFVKLESAKGALVSIKRGNGLNMLEFKQICVENNGKFVYKGIELDSGRYKFRRQQNLDEIWVGDAAPAQHSRKKRRSAADGVVDAEAKLDEQLLLEQQQALNNIGLQVQQAENEELEQNPPDMFVYFDSVIDSALFFLDERFGAFNEAPLIYFKIFSFCTWPEQGPPAEYGNSSVSKLLLHFQKVLGQDVKDSALGEWPVLKQYLLQCRKHCTGKLRSFSDVYVTLLIEQRWKHSSAC